MTLRALRANPWLLPGAVATAVAALAHLACIVFGAPAYLAMGAGPRMAQLAEAGHWYPPAITPVIEPYFPGNSEGFWFWSSAACALVGALYLMGLWRTTLAPRDPDNV